MESHYEDLIYKVKGEGNFNGIEGNVHYYYKDLVTLFDYFDKPILYLDEPPLRIKDRLKSLHKEFGESMRSRYEKGYLLKSQVDVLHKDSELIHQMEKFPVVNLSTLSHKDGLIHPKHKVEMQVRSVSPYHNSFDLLIKDIQSWVNRNYKVMLLSASKTRANRMIEMLRDRDIKAYPPLFDMNKEMTDGMVAVSYGSLHKGFEYPQIQMVVLTETELVGKQKKKT